MAAANLKNIVTKAPDTWVKEGDSFPEIIRSEDGTLVRAEYVELPNGELMIMEYELSPEELTEIRKKEADAHIAQTKDTENASDEEEDFREESPDEQRRYLERRKRYQRVRQQQEQQRTRRRFAGRRTVVTVIICACIAGLCVAAVHKFNNSSDRDNTTEVSVKADFSSGQDAQEDTGANALADYASSSNLDGDTGSDAVSQAEPEIHPHCVDSTDPSNLIASTSISVNDEVLTEGQTYQAEDAITFGSGSSYSALPGVITFRGNNYRSDPTYGYADLQEYDLETVWSKQTGVLTSGEKTWSGSGWTGQPLIVQWPKEVRQHMNMYDWAKQKDDLVEVIYACMDGNIYFLDLETGESTREVMQLGYTFKGAGSLDPRGYPIMYLGAGINSNDGAARVFVINLLDCSVMYTFGNSDSFAPRGISFFDSSALVDEETDTLIYPGENGVLYFVKLGTVYDADAGTLSINPEQTVKWTYRTHRNGSAYWYGMEDSAVVYQGYLYIMDNGGDFMCLDINTLQLIWVQDSLDDSNGSPVLSVEGDKVYLYASTSFHLGWRSSTTAQVPIWKIDAETGEIIWQTEYECQSMEDLSGGVQSTAALGRAGLSDYIYVTVSRTGGMSSGVLACLSKTDGSIVWEHEATYTWSSPVCVYNSDGSGSVVYCSGNGKMYLLDGLTGEQLDAEVLSDGVIEASPAVYNNYAVVGTRNCYIRCVKLK